jgi:hypothetical protein
MPEPTMTDTSDLCCERCGGTAFSHFFGSDGRGQRRWQNRCTACGRTSEYVPTQAEIAVQCREIRAQQQMAFLDDDQEKLWRRLHAPEGNTDDFDGDDWPAAA